MSLWTTIQLTAFEFDLNFIYYVRNKNNQKKCKGLLKSNYVHRWTYTLTTKCRHRLVYKTRKLGEAVSQKATVNK